MSELIQSNCAELGYSKQGYGAQRLQRLHDLGVNNKRYYLLDVFRRRLNYSDLKRKAKELAKRDRPNKIVLKDKAAG